MILLSLLKLGILSDIFLRKCECKPIKVTYLTASNSASGTRRRTRGTARHDAGCGRTTTRAGRGCGTRGRIAGGSSSARLVRHSMDSSKRRCRPSVVSVAAFYNISAQFTPTRCVLKTHAVVNRLLKLILQPVVHERLQQRLAVVVVVVRGRVDKVQRALEQGADQASLVCVLGGGG